MGDEGPVYRKDPLGRYVRDESGRTAEVQRNVLTDEPVPLRDEHGWQVKAGDGTPLYEERHIGGGGEGAAGGLILIGLVIVIALAALIVAGAALAVGTVALWWGRGLYRSFRRDREQGVLAGPQTLAWAGGGVAAVAIVAVAAATASQLPRHPLANPDELARQAAIYARQDVREGRTVTAFTGAMAIWAGDDFTAYVCVGREIRDVDGSTLADAEFMMFNLGDAGWELHPYNFGPGAQEDSLDVCVTSAMGNYRQEPVPLSMPTLAVAPFETATTGESTHTPAASPPAPGQATPSAPPTAKPVATKPKPVRGWPVWTSDALGYTVSYPGDLEPRRQVSCDGFIGETGNTAQVCRFPADGDAMTWLIQTATADAGPLALESTRQTAVPTGAARVLVFTGTSEGRSASREYVVFVTEDAAWWVSWVGAPDGDGTDLRNAERMAKSMTITGGGN